MKRNKHVLHISHTNLHHLLPIQGLCWLVYHSQMDFLIEIGREQLLLAQPFLILLTFLTNNCTERLVRPIFCSTGVPSLTDTASFLDPAIQELLLEPFVLCRLNGNILDLEWLVVLVSEDHWFKATLKFRQKLV